MADVHDNKQFISRFQRILDWLTWPVPVPAFCPLQGMLVSVVQLTVRRHIKQAADDLEANDIYLSTFAF